MKLETRYYDHFTMANNIEKLVGPIFVEDINYWDYIDAKMSVDTHNPYQKYYLLDNQEEVVAEFMRKATGLDGSLNQMASCLQEDICIHTVRTVPKNIDWLSYTHVSFPSGWSPEFSIGKSFLELHKQVPGFVYNENLLPALLCGKYQRFVWSPIFENKLNQHPSNRRFFSRMEPNFWLKIEKQMFIGFKQASCFLFVIRQYIYDKNEVDFGVLRATISNMTQEQKDYKNISPEFEDWIKKQ